MNLARWFKAEPGLFQAESSDVDETASCLPNYFRLVGTLSPGCIMRDTHDGSCMLYFHQVQRWVQSLIRFHSVDPCVKCTELTNTKLVNYTNQCTTFASYLQKSIIRSISSIVDSYGQQATCNWSLDPKLAVADKHCSLFVFGKRETKEHAAV